MKLLALSSSRVRVSGGDSPQSLEVGHTLDVYVRALRLLLFVRLNEID